jgi:hypothetical protein
MKYKFTFILIFIWRLSYSQQTNYADSIDFYIKNLSWSSFEITNNYISQLTLNHDAKRLIELEDKNKLKKLLRAITEKDKTVIIHVIFSQILEPDSSNFLQVYKYAKDSTVESVQYTYNGLRWFKDIGGRNHIYGNGIRMSRKYWRNKVLEKSKKEED